ncbi:hypothetical protein CCL23_15900 [Pseudomonas syringae]|nr:hypothetical protein CCL23_15900 [Pseudomonas syringae]
MCQCQETVSCFTAQRVYSIVPEKFRPLTDSSVLIFIPNQQAIIFSYPATAFRKSVSVMIKVNVTFSRNRLNSIAIKIEYKRATCVFSSLE